MLDLEKWNRLVGVLELVALRQQLSLTRYVWDIRKRNSVLCLVLLITKQNLRRLEDMGLTFIKRV